MIRSLRQRHLWMVAAVAVSVLVLFLAALAARPVPPVQKELPQRLEANSP